MSLFRFFSIIYQNLSNIFVSLTCEKSLHDASIFSDGYTYEISRHVKDFAGRCYFPLEMKLNTKSLCGRCCFWRQMYADSMTGIWHENGNSETHWFKAEPSSSLECWRLVITGPIVIRSWLKYPGFDARWRCVLLFSGLFSRINFWMRAQAFVIFYEIFNASFRRMFWAHPSSAFLFFLPLISPFLGRHLINTCLTNWVH